jgi:hypothetical protein
VFSDLRILEIKQKYIEANELVRFSACSFPLHLNRSLQCGNIIKACNYLFNFVQTLTELLGYTLVKSSWRFRTMDDVELVLQTGCHSTCRPA